MKQPDAPRSALPYETRPRRCAGDAVIDMLFHQAGVLRFRGGEQLFNTADFFERQPLPRGRRIGIVSNSAAVATLAADACATRGPEVRGKGPAEPRGLGDQRPSGEYAATIRELLGDAGTDALMVFYVDVHDGDPEGVLDAISAASGGQPKPVVASVLRSDGRLPASSGAGVPNYLFPESCAAVLARVAHRREQAEVRRGSLSGAVTTRFLSVGVGPCRLGRG